MALVGTVLIVFGSSIGASAPGDGQTGMVMFPLWGLGGAAGISAMVIANRFPEAKRIWPVIIGLTIISLLSIGWSFRASWVYEQNWEETHKQ